MRSERYAEAWLRFGMLGIPRWLFGGLDEVKGRRFEDLTRGEAAIVLEFVSRLQWFRTAYSSLLGIAWMVSTDAVANGAAQAITRVFAFGIMLWPAMFMGRLNRAQSIILKECRIDEKKLEEPVSQQTKALRVLDTSPLLAFASSLLVSIPIVAFAV